MRSDLVTGNPFPDLRLPDHTGSSRSLSELAGAVPLVLVFSRGWWCPKDQVRLRNLTAMQEELQREYGRVVVVTTDEPYVNGAFRAGLGADFPFLSDEARVVAEELGMTELTDEKHRPFLPLTFVLDSRLVIRGVWCGFWHWGNPTPDELRLALREVTRTEQPTFDPVGVWAAGGAAPPDAGIESPVVWICEDGRGNELSRGAWEEDELPEVGTRIVQSSVDGRWWTVVAVERKGDRVAVHQRKEGEPDPDPRAVRHSISAPRLSSTL
jgi:peroxiredoxin